VITRGSDWTQKVEVLAVWLLAFLWAAPLLYAIWAAFHPMDFISRFVLTAPLTLDNFRNAWKVAPFARYFMNSFILVSITLAGQFILCTMAAYAFARFEFPGKEIAFLLVLVQIMIMPDVSDREELPDHQLLGWWTPSWGRPTLHGLGFGIFLLRQAFKQVPKELEEAARVEGAGWLSVLWKVYIPLAKPTYLAYGLVSVSYHWNNFLWP